MFEKKKNLCVSFFFLSKIHKIQLYWVGPVYCKAYHSHNYYNLLIISFRCFFLLYGFSFVSHVFGFFWVEIERNWWKTKISCSAYVIWTIYSISFSTYVGVSYTQSKYDNSERVFFSLYAIGTHATYNRMTESKRESQPKRQLHV